MKDSRDEEEWISMQALNPDLVRRVTEGEYEIDPHAVAEAMLRRNARINQLRRMSRVLVTRERKRPAFRPEQQ